MDNSATPLAGRTALVTGISRRRGIGYAVARKLASLGANIVIQHYQRHDDGQSIASAVPIPHGTLAAPPN